MTALRSDDSQRELVAIEWGSRCLGGLGAFLRVRFLPAFGGQGSRFGSRVHIGVVGQDARLEWARLMEGSASLWRSNGGRAASGGGEPCCGPVSC